ncbi:cytochrome c biogenesis protein ResB [Effusibacillus dendaii]|uniref:Cytochrome c biogenesis protein ResB n=1 Tax=Effusibacillus dendaii TaxID=2743772 RepID=A0A7I8D6L7_9BACL|nr:cytochrome c biogenesis protein ResB [Effusibacillus dendaii]BCJ85783.1 cytochrome c biogenesis protein ResB [Effusibacillus dendaii]
MNSLAANKRRSVFELIWDFFASVKVAIVIIVLIAISAMIGTIFPQENFIPSSSPETYYPATYGTLGKIYYQLGFSHMYTSWWFVALLLLLGVSLVICSLERVIPLYKSLHRQEIKPALSVVQRKRVYTSFEKADDALADRMAAELRKRRYKIRREGSAFLAEKMRISRFGAYVIHIGLIIIILGALSRLIPGWYVSQNIWVEEGQTVKVPGSDFYVRNDQFTVEFYPDQRPKHYETKATIIENGKEVLKQSIIVNEPLKYKGIMLFQANFLPPTLRLLNLDLKDKQTGSKLGTFTVDLSKLQTEYKVGDYTVKMINYFPDFDIQNDQPVTKSTDPNNPVFLMQVEGPGVTQPVQQFLFVFQQFNMQQGSKFDLTPSGGKMVQTTGLRVQKDNGIPIVYGGSAIVLLGLVLVFYFQHRRVWGQIHDGVLHVGAQTNKNWYAMRKEMERVLKAMGRTESVELRQGGKE